MQLTLGDGLSGTLAIDQLMQLGLLRACLCLLPDSFVCLRHFHLGRDTTSFNLQGRLFNQIGLLSLPASVDGPVCNAFKCQRTESGDA